MKDALDRLTAGNLRYIKGEPSIADFSKARREELVTEQNPFAIILSCADSRVPSEVLFDQGLGDLFVVRVAGNIASPSQVGSIEFAAAVLGAKLVVVLGHSHCGAVEATLGAIADPSSVPSESIQSIVEEIKANLESKDDASLDHSSSLDKAIRQNVKATCAALLDRSALLKDMVESNEAQIIGAHYDLKSGLVEFIE